MQNNLSNQKRYYRFPRPSSIVDYSPDYTDYYPYPDTSDDNGKSESNYEDSYMMKGDDL